MPDDNEVTRFRTHEYKAAFLRHSALVTASSQEAQLGTRLRRSALTAASPQAAQIRTLENPDLDHLIVALATVLKAYVDDTSEKGEACSELFNEEHHPLDASRSWKSVPLYDDVDAFVRQLVVTMQLDDVCLVTALILIERAMRQAGFVLNERSWRPGFLVALLIAMKATYDEDTFLADCQEAIPGIELHVTNEQEAAFLTMIGFNTLIRRGQYAKYYYALQDVVGLYNEMLPPED
jgi:hypothetical protein